VNRSVLFLSGLSLVGGSLVFACSSSTEDASIGGDQAEVTSCKPPTLHEAGAGPYCPFQGPDASTASACATAQHCCNPGQGNGDAVCVDNGTACPFPTNGTGPGPDAGGTEDAGIILTPDAGGIDWQCDSPDQCADGEVCCAAVTIAADTYCPGQVKASKSHGSACRTKCLSGEQQTCAAASECKGKACTPYSVSGKQLGYCGSPPDAGVKKDAGTKKDASTDTGADDDTSSDDDTDTTPEDAGKKTTPTYRLPSSVASGCAAAPGTVSSGAGGLASLGLGLGLALAATRRRRARRG